MAVGFTLLTSGYDSTDLTTYTTASVAATSGRVLLLLTLSRHTTAGSNATPSSVSGLGATWTKQTESTSGVSRTSIWSGLGGSTTSTVSITMGAAILGAAWALFELTGADTTTPVVQAVASSSATGTSNTVTLAAFGSVNNATIAASGWAANEQGTQKSGWTKDPATNPAGASPNSALLAQWLASNDTTPSATWSTSAVNTMVAAEIAAAAVAAQVLHQSPMPALIAQ